MLNFVQIKNRRVVSLSVLDVIKLLPRTIEKSVVTSVSTTDEAEYLMKNYGNRGGCYNMALMDNTL